jgi:hypothetical protein
MAVEVKALLKYEHLDKRPDESVWALDPDLKWVEWKGARYKQRIIRFTSDSMREIAQAAKDLRDSCPVKPYYLGGQEPVFARVAAFLVTRTCPDPGFIVEISIAILPEEDGKPSTPRRHLDEVLLEDIHTALGIL